MNQPFDPQIPFFFPTSILLLDDHKSFLQALRTTLTQNRAVLGFSTAKQALRHLQENESRNRDIFDVFAAAKADSTDKTAEINDPVIVLQASKLHELAWSSSRYKLISVAIVDEVMPDMRGLDFCRELKDSGVKTILLTGRMEDTTSTIDAFNAGIIDRFISKKDPDVLNKLNSAITELQHSFFKEGTDALKRALHSFDGLSKPFRDDMKSLMHHIHDEFPFCEYYYDPSSAGYILRDANGDTRLCVLATKEQLKMRADRLEAQIGRETAEICQLRKGERIPRQALLEDTASSAPQPDMLADILFPANDWGALKWALFDQAQCPHKPADKASQSWNAYRSLITSKPINWSDAN